MPDFQREPVAMHNGMGFVALDIREVSMMLVPASTVRFEALWCGLGNNPFRSRSVAASMGLVPAPGRLQG